MRVRDSKKRRPQKAEELAQEIARFRQACVRSDRRSTIKSHGLTVREALTQEWYNGRNALVDLTDILDQRDRDYCIDALRSR
jgi:hypothetical protein